MLSCYFFIMANIFRISDLKVVTIQNVMFESLGLSPSPSFFKDHLYSFEKLWIPSGKESTDCPSNKRGRQRGIHEIDGYHRPVAV